MIRHAGIFVVGTLVLLGGCQALDLLRPNPPADEDLGDTFTLAGQQFRADTLVTGLEVPWSIGFAPDGSLMFVTERPGWLLTVDPVAGTIIARTDIDGVVPQVARSERGLMGLAVSPDFDQDRTVYISFTADRGDAIGFKNVIDRWRLLADGHFERVGTTFLVDFLPASFIHDGMPIRFGPDGKLYVSTGDATERDGAQDRGELNGKYLRFNPDGSIPADNPFGPTSPVYTLGHRNSQGFDFVPGRPDLIVATEHGPSFPIDGPGGRDEINLLRAGRNYGWPVVFGDDSALGLESPIWQSGEVAIAPGGGTFVTSPLYPAWQGKFLFAALRDQSLWVAEIDPDAANPLIAIEEAANNAFGRLRAVAQGPDGYLYVSTSNRDSRGTPTEGDDRILRLVPLP